ISRSEPDGVCLRLPHASRRDAAPHRPSHRGGGRLAGRLRLRISAVGGIPAVLRHDAGGISQALVGRITKETFTDTSPNLANGQLRAAVLDSVTELDLCHASVSGTVD